VAVQVLICDDQEVFRAAAREVVNATRGFEVVGEAETGEESVAAAGLLHPDLVLMDIHLPGIDGLEASRRIRAAHPNVTVLLLSTYDPEEFAARIEGSGAIAFIPKAAFGPDGLTTIWAGATVTGSSQWPEPEK
jgi:DNA-binding NarL/FixJ family response regulator